MQAYYVIHPGVQKSEISPEIYGNFAEHLASCVYGGVYVGEDSHIPNINGMRCDVVEALKKIHLPVLRWPGGCFASDYHWRDGIGPKAGRKRQLNNCWGKVAEDNSFGTHEFMELCRQIGCKPYINGNLESGTVAEMQEWIEYMTLDGDATMANLRKANGQEKPWEVPYFCMGNENWGYGGNMTAQQYAFEYRKYQSFVRNYGENKIYKIAVGPGCAYKEPILDWTRTVMEIAGKFMDGLSIHFYAIPADVWEPKGSATDFTVEEWYHTLMKASYMDELIDRTIKVMDEYDAGQRVGLIVDEWGAWYDVEPGTHPDFHFQQNSMRDAMIAGLTLNIFNKYSSRVKMANIAQLANVMQAVVFTGDDQLVLTPTYHVFDLYKEHMGATLVDSRVFCPQAGTKKSTVEQISESASVDAAGWIHSTVCNLSCSDTAEMTMEVLEEQIGHVEGTILAGAMNSHNTFENPDEVHCKPFEDFEIRTDGRGSRVTFTMPPCSVLKIKMK